MRASVYVSTRVSSFYREIQHTERDYSAPRLQGITRLFRGASFFRADPPFHSIAGSHDVRRASMPRRFPGVLRPTRKKSPNNRFTQLKNCVVRLIDIVPHRYCGRLQPGTTS